MSTSTLHGLPPLVLTLIGIGTGNPDHLTRQAIKAMNAADLILLPHKGEDKAELAALRQALCDEVLVASAPRIAGFDMPVRRSQGDDYLAQVDEWHAAIARCWQDAIVQVLGPAAKGSALTPQPLQVALLVWGDPSLYDSTLRIAARMQPAPVRVDVVAGITSVQALAAAHAVPLNDVGQPFVVTTGRQLREQGWPAGVDTAVVMLDGQCSFTVLPPEGLHIWWGAYLGMPQQLLDSGPLAEAGPRIERTRAAARLQHGWIMDIYLLRRAQRLPDQEGPSVSAV